MQQENMDLYMKILDSIDDKVGSSEERMRGLPEGVNIGSHVSFRGTVNPECTKFFISIPHFTASYSVPLSTSVQHARPGNYRPARVIVHWTHFAVCNIGKLTPTLITGVPRSQFSVDTINIIAILKTAGKDHSTLFPFVPNQNRISSLHLLIHMISTLAQHSAKHILENFQFCVSEIVSKISNVTIGIM
jgi:hypothetical protein